MQRLRKLAPGACLLAALIVPASPSRPGQLPRSGTPTHPIADAMRAVYVHGVTEELAGDLVARWGPEAFRVLRGLLLDPGFSRRDNVVAFLAHLGDDAAARDLLALLDDPPAGWRTPEEERALLLAPQALGLIARRADAVALEALLGMTDPAGDLGPLPAAAREHPDPQAALAELLGAALRGLAYSEAPEARDRLIDIRLGRLTFPRLGRDLSASAAQALDLLEQLGQARSGGAGDLAPQDPSGVPEPEPQPEQFDTQTRAHDSGLTYANHAELGNKMTDSRLDQALGGVNLRAGRSDYDGDVACCITGSRVGSGGTFGQVGDGLNVIDDNAELGAVMNDPVARVKVVAAINYCGGPGFNIIGCASRPGDGIAVVRLDNATDEGVVWLHEYGHNTGLGHAGDFRRIMHGTVNGINNGLVQNECDSYHNPPFPSLTHPIVNDTGACTDADTDEVQDGIDNCPAAANAGQQDGEGDGVGDACDNCAATANPDQADFDADGSGDACDADDDGDSVADADDCAPLDASVAHLPGEPGDLRWSSADTVTWTAGPFAETSNVYRGDLVPAFEPSWSCRADGVPGTTFDDFDTPAPGAGFHYVVTGENGCGESGAGTASDGTPREVDLCP